MEYEKYLENIKKIIKNLTIVQRVGIGVFLLLAIGIGIYFLNPQKKLLEMRNSQRRSDVVNILNAIYQYGSDHGDQLASLVSETPAMICRSDAVSCDGMIDVSQVLLTQKKILSKVPVDPREKNKNSSGYQVSRLVNGRISVSAPLAENGAVISLSK